MPFELRIAIRYLVARRKQAFISVITFISMLGVTVGVMALMIALGLMTGLQREIRSKILGTTAHLHVFHGGAAAVEDYREVVREVRDIPEVVGSAPTVYTKAMISSTSASAFATVKGVHPDFERSVTDLGNQVEMGELEALREDGADGLSPILLGRGMARQLAVGPGDVVRVMSPRGRLSPLGMLPRVTRMRVAGMVRSGLYEFDNSWAYVPFRTAQRLASIGDAATQIEVRVSDMWDVRRNAGDILNRLGAGYLTTDWIEMNGPLFSALWLEKTAIAITIALIVAVASLNIVATLILMVMDKHHDIAVLVSMGASRVTITRIFMLQGVVIGIVGTAVGALLGWGACELLDAYQVIKVPGDVYQISYVPFILLPRDAAIVIVGALLTCFAATIYPARGAMKLDPAEALRV